MKARPSITGKAPALALVPPCALEAETFMLGCLELVVLRYQSAPHAPGPSLTPAEQHVVELLIRGLRTKDIAALRGTSLHTVSNQLATIYRKFSVSTRQELLAKF